MKKIGFVAPWYGEDIGGGAEAELRAVVHHLKDAGVALEVLTTCAESFSSDWNKNHHRPGLREEAGIFVRRFRLRKRNTEAFDRTNEKLMRGERLTEEEEDTFCKEMVNSPGLYRYIRRHGKQFELFVFIPYMFGTTYYGCQVYPEKSVLIPCLHDESYAYMRCFRKVFSQIGGMIFNAEPERLLAERLYGIKGEKYITFGIGMDTDWQTNAERFRAKFGIKVPFILYAGRKDTGKRVDLLISYYMKYRKRNPQTELKLVLIGGGEIGIPDSENILDLGYLDQQDKLDAYGAAAFFCNPSEMESFSLVVMESWLAERPVLVNKKCTVTEDFVRQAQGGMSFENYDEFEKGIITLTENTELAERMGKNGRRYVLDHFDWKVITRKYKEYFEGFNG